MGASWEFNASRRDYGNGSTTDTAAGDAHWHVTEWDTTTTWPKIFDIKVDS